MLVKEIRFNLNTIFTRLFDFTIILEIIERHFGWTMIYSSTFRKSTQFESGFMYLEHENSFL